MQILIVEDDRRISDFLVKGLEEVGYVITLCKSVEEVLQQYLSLNFDLMIIDVMLPGIDGIQLVQTIRYKKIFTPILMLSALNSVLDKTTALDSGADDYMTKPFHFDELLARIKALTRRNQYDQLDTSKHIQDFGPIQIDTHQYKVHLNQNPVDLSPREFKLLKYLCDNYGKVVTRQQILNAVWGIHFENPSNVVDVYISYLRNKLESKQKFIHTVKGIGYLFKVE